MTQDPKQLQNHVKLLQRKRNAANKDFLDALTYVRPFEEVKKLFFDLKTIEAELENFKVKQEVNKTA
jgi:uncharacterized protein YerC